MPVMIGVEPAEIAGGEILLAEQLHVDAELREARRHLVADAHHVADLQARTRS